LASPLLCRAITSPIRAGIRRHRYFQGLARTAVYGKFPAAVPPIGEVRDGPLTQCATGSSAVSAKEVNREAILIGRFLFDGVQLKVSRTWNGA